MAGVTLAVPEPPLGDGQVALRPWRPADVDQIYTICQDPEILRWTLMPDPFTRQVAERFVAGVPDQWDGDEAAPFCVTPADDAARVIGAIGLYVKQPAIGHIGYWVAAERRGRGVATAALRLVSAWAFAETGCARLELEIIPGNDGSARVAERSGFRLEGRLRSSIDQRGTRHDGLLYGRVPGDPVPGDSVPGDPG